MRANDAHPTQGFITEHGAPHRVSGSSSPDASASYRQQMEALLNSLGEGLIATDANGQITMVNAYATNCLGYQAEELLGQWFPKTIMAVGQHSQPIEKMNRPIIKALTTGRTVSENAYYLRKNGSMVPVFITVSPILVDETPTGAIEIFRDLTKEQQLNVAKDEFVSLASHQLRTPATAVKSILAMLSAGDFGPLTAEQQKYIDKAVQSNDRQLHVIESLLNVALVDAGRMELDLEYIDLAALLREAISDHVDATASRNQAIALDTPSQCRLLVDVPKIRMVIDNLVSNASKYSEPGATIEIVLRRTPHHAVLSVTDEGVGIPPSELDRLFTKFSRIDNEFSATVGGTGLGLFLARHIIELHHGNISVRSQEGTGSTFTVALPTVWRSN